MNNEWQLSNESKSFIENMRVYLFSNGKNPNEIEAITAELSDHLFEAEKDGKPIEKIIGKSPKDYMKMVSNEMLLDYRTCLQYICLIVLCSFSFTIFSDLSKGSLSYSVLQIIGHVVIGLLFIATVVAGFKYLSTRNLSVRKQLLVFIPIGILPIGLFLGLIYLNKAVTSPIIHFNTIECIIIGAATALAVIAVSLWAKSWLLVILIPMLTLPDYFLSLLSLKLETRLIISPIISFVGIASYLWFLNKSETNKEGS